ncbi:MAG: DUF72 domain-containing protein [Chloroflexota bacterium]
MIRLGTSGFSYDDWVGPFYAPDLPKWAWLSFYAQEFDTVELNVTYYRLPDQRTVAGWLKRTPDGFLFAVKAHQSLTHDREYADFDGFRRSIDELRQAGKLACVLAQFPHSFHPTHANRQYLPRLREGLGDLPVVVEFRDSAWLDEETFEQLEKHRLGFCCVDEPRLPGLMPPVARATAPVAYVRFHGRNAQRWWQHEQAWERYDYTYSASELLEWVDKIRDLDDRSEITLIYANNHYRSQSIDTIRLLRQMLVES